MCSTRIASAESLFFWLLLQIVKSEDVCPMFKLHP